MFDLTSSKLLILGIVALIVVGPKDLPILLRTIGKYVGMIRRQANEFKSQFDEAMRESELDSLKARSRKRRSRCRKHNAQSRNQRRAGDKAVDTEIDQSLPITIRSTPTIKRDNPSSERRTPADPAQRSRSPRPGKTGIAADRPLQRPKNLPSKLPRPET